MDHEELIDLPQRPPLFLPFLARRRRLLSMAALAALALAAGGAAVVLLRAPRQQEARCHFRLEFNGAERGRYPSGLRFTPQEITGAASLRRIYDESGLQSAGIAFDDMRQGLYVVESDPALERLRSEMGPRLAAARSSIERDGIENLYALRKSNLNTREYDLVLALPSRHGVTADQMKRVLTATLETWAATTARQKARIDFAGLTPQELNVDAFPGRPLLALEELRMKTNAGRWRAMQLASAEGAALIADPQSGLTAKAVDTRLTDIVRWDIDPLVAQLVRRHIFDQGTIDTLTSQIRYGAEQARFEEGRTAAIQEGIAIYSRTPSAAQPPPRSLSVEAPAPQRQPTREAPFGSGEPAVVTQIDSSVIDRIAEMTAQSADRSFRQTMAMQLVNERTSGVPARIENEHFRALLQELTQRGGTPTAATPDDDAAVRAIGTRVRDTVAAMDRVADRLSETQVLSAAFYSMIEPPYVQRRTFIPDLRLLAVVVLPLLALITFAAVLFLIDSLRVPAPGRTAAEEEA